VVKEQRTLIALAGPTAIGKTDLAIRLALYFGTEIISADSRQHYRELIIGTAKASSHQLSKVIHHQVNNLSIHDTYSSGQYERDTLLILEQLFKKNSIAIMTGGTGLYFKAIMEGMDAFPEVAQEILLDLQQNFDKKGITYLQEACKAVDPEYYASADVHNPHRLIRALSVYHASGQPYTSFLKRNKPFRPFNTISIVLTMNREQLYQRINDRVLQMMDKGLLEEVKSLYEFKHLKSLNTVGYRELFSYLKGEITLEDAINLIQRNSRRYAKRQITWFRNQGSWHVFDYDDYDGIIAHIDMKINLLRK
jgi:tRNA dimethylallyltransferase